MSAKVSRTLSHLDFPRLISQARGTPAIRSKAATLKAIMKEFLMAVSAVFIRAGWLMTFWMVDVFVKMPIIGGIRIIARKTIIAKR
jgi:hypothetical protein